MSNRNPGNSMSNSGISRIFLTEDVLKAYSQFRMKNCMETVKIR